LLNAYKEGYFPMAESRDGDIFWHNPNQRAVIPLEKAIMPRSLRQFLKKYNFEYTVNNNFSAVIEYCSYRNDTWINDEIIEAYIKLNEAGYAHSVETWFEGELIGGLYGVSIGGAFFGESMFNLVDNASKAAFYYLVERLKNLNFLLLDSHYLNNHTKNLGAIEIPKFLYLIILKKAMELPCSFI
jgi:leucyl/phenylalanyl-tRNA---protein transferase